MNEPTPTNSTPTESVPLAAAPVRRDALRLKLDLYGKAQTAMGVGLVVVLLGVYVLGLRPAGNRAVALAIETEKKQTEFQAAELRARDLAAVEAEVDKLKARLDRFDRRLPSQRESGQELGQFMRDITHISQQGSIQKITAVPGAPKKSDLFSELPISLKFEGDFLSVYSFLQQTEAMQRLTRVRSLSLKARDTKRGQVDVQVSMNLFFADN